MPSVQLRSFGGLNTDSHVQDIRNGDYTDAKNIEHVSAEKGESMAITPRTGNEFAFNIGSVEAQSKRYLFKFPLNTNDGIYYIRVKNPNGVTDLVPGALGLIEIQSRNTFASDVESVFFGSTVIDATQDPIIGPSINTQKEIAYILELLPPGTNSNADLFRFQNFFIVNEIIDLPSGNKSGIIDVQCISECIPSSRTGELEVIGSKDILGDLFIISSNKRTDPIEINLSDLSVDVQLFGIYVYITFPQQYNYLLTDGMEIYISGVFGLTTINGLYVTSPISNNTILLVNWIEAFNQQNGNSSDPYEQGTGKITFNPFGIGEIGVATKNESRNEWTYTRLLRSRELNFWIKHQFDTDGEISSNKKSLYFTDNYNAPKLFYYKDDAPYVEDGAIGGIYPQYGLFNYDFIEEQTNHILGQPSIDIEFESQSLSGSLVAGNYRYFVRGVLSDGAKTDWSLPSRVVSVYASRTDDAAKIIGDYAGTQTNKANNIVIKNVNSSIYDKIEVACINYYDQAADPTAPNGIFNITTLRAGQTEYSISHTGREQGIDLVVEELSVQTEQYFTAKNNAIVDNRYLLSNLNSNQFDFSTIVDSFKYSIERKETTRFNYRPDGSLGINSFGGHQDPLNIFYYTGYMINETYRIGARLKLKNGFTSPVYHLFDVTINTDQESADGKRLSGLSDYSLVSLDQTNSENDKNIVPYIRIYPPNLFGTVINGVPLSQIIERIEYFRVEIGFEKETIKGWGLSVLGISGNSVQLPIIGLTPGTGINYGNTINNQSIIYEFPLMGNEPVYDRKYSDVPSANKFPVCSIYFADDLINASETASSISIFPGYKLINFGHPIPRYNFQGLDGYPSYIYTGYYEYVTQSNISPQTLDITSSGVVTPSQSKSFTINTFNTTFVKNTAYVFTATGGTDILEIVVDDINNMGGINPTQGGLFGAGFYFEDENGSYYAEYFIPAFQGLADEDFISTFNSSSVNFPQASLIQTSSGTGVRFRIFNAPFAEGDPMYLRRNLSGDPVLLGTFQQVGTPASSSTLYSNVLNYKSSNVIQFDSSNQSEPLSSFVQPSNDYGVRLVQVLNEVQDQYPEGQVLNYVYTGSYTSLSNQSLGYADLFGGDSFTISPYIKVTSAIESLQSDTIWYSPTIWGALDAVGSSLSQCMNITVQSKNNHYLRNKGQSSDIKIFPESYIYTSGIVTSTFVNWVSEYGFASNTNPYNNGYSLSSLIYGYRANDPFNSFSTRIYKNRIIYSDLKLQGSYVDNYRRFGILSYADLDSSFGEIIDMKNINGELFTLQPNKYQRQFFNTRGTLQLSDASQIVLGDASVLSRPGVTITSYGCSNKWSVFLGRSQGGDDVIYWYDRIRKKFMRFGADGAVPISDRAFVRTGALNDTKWVLDFDSPALNYGMHGVWNQRLGEAIWTIRAHRKPDLAWVGPERGTQPVAGETPIVYKVNEIVYLEDETNFLNFEQTIVLYVVIQEHSSSLGIKPGVDPGWEDYFSRPSIDDKNYYNINTISYSEFKNRFSQFQETYHPRIYLQWNDTFLSPRPKDPESNVYEHNAGDILRWYAHNGEIQEEEGYIEVVFNIDPNVTKRYVALICNSEYTPYRLELETRTQTTFINGPEFEQQLEQFFAPIPNVEVNGQTGLDNDFMYGQWVKIRFFYQPGEFQRFTNIVLKFNPMVRLWNT